MDSIIKIKSNVCPICYKDNLSWHPLPKASQVEVFVCKHFTCKECYNRIEKNIFSCPICRNEGQSYRDSFSSIEVKKWLTISDWYYHWEEYMKINHEGLKRSTFGKIYFGLVDDIKHYIQGKKEEKKRKNIQIKKDNERERKRKEKENSICKLCGTKCTSLIQLNRHVNSKNCLKKQKYK